MFTNRGSEDRKVMVYFPAVGVRFWVSKTVDPESMVTVRLWLLEIAANPSKEVRVIVLGNLVATVLLTVMVTEALVLRFPALSWAWAKRVWLALVRVVVSKALEADEVVEVA